jgi:hypothetical protein
MEVQGKALRIMDELRGESLVEKQQTKQGFNVDQALNALESGEDQATGRVRQQLQRNEDLDIGTIDRLEDQTNNINVAASLTPDGIPADQAELLPGDPGYHSRLNNLIHQQNVEANPRVLTSSDIARNLQKMQGGLVPGDEGYYSRLDDLIHQQNVEANPRPLTTEDIARNREIMGGGPRINQLLDDAKRYLRAQEVDLGYDYGPENLRQTAQVNERIARALDLKNTAERIIREERGQLDPIDVARTRSADERARLAAQGFAGEKLEQQLLENMRANFPEGREVMAPLQEETRRIERVGMPSALSVVENVGSVAPLKQGEERIGKPASQQAGYEGGIRGMGRVTREDLEESSKTIINEPVIPFRPTQQYVRTPRAGGMGVYGFESAFAPGAIRKMGQFGESEYGEIGYEYSPAAQRRPTQTAAEAEGKIALEDLPNPYSKLSDEQLGELTMYGSEEDKYNAQQQLQRRKSAEVSTRLRTLQLSNEPGAAENFLTRFKQGLV